MQTHRFFVTVASLLTVAAAQADVYMGLGLHKNFDQSSATKLTFQGGEMNLLLRDGLVILDGACVTQPDVFPFPPSDIPPCPLGATGFVAAGDIDRDGVRDDNQYWSVLSVIPALLIEPFRADLCELYSAPPSKLQRPLSGFREDGLITFFDIRDTAMRQYNQSRYELIRRYGSVQQVESITAKGLILASGVLRVTVTGADIPESPIDIFVPVEAGDVVGTWAEKMRVAMAADPRLTSVYGVTRTAGVTGIGATINLTENTPNGNDSTLNIAIFPGTASNTALPILQSVNTATGELGGQGALNLMNEELVNGTYTFTFPRLDRPDDLPVAISINITPNLEALGSMPRTPRTGFRFTSGSWDDGYYQMDPRVINKITWTGNDRSNIRPGDQFYFSMLAGEGNTVAFPPTGNPVILSTPAVTSYTLPPFFFNLGDEGRINLDYNRFLATGGVAYDVSERTFRARVRMVDTYTGFASINFPLGTPKRSTAVTANFDGDAYTNVEEYAFEWPTADYINFLNPDGDPETDDAENLNFGLPAAQDPDPSRPAVDAIPAGSFPKISVPVVELDDTNRIVVKASKRPLTGATLKYAFQILDTTKAKPKYKQVKAGADWTITNVTEVETVVINGVSIDMPHDYVVLTSTLPVADPLAPLPQFKVKITAQKL